MKSLLRAFGALVASVLLGAGLAALAVTLRPDPDWTEAAGLSARQAVARALGRPAEELAFRDLTTHQLEGRGIRGLCGQVARAGAPPVEFVAHVQRLRPWNPMEPAELRAEAVLARDAESRREVYLARRRYCPETVADPARAAPRPELPAMAPEGPPMAQAAPPSAAPPPASAAGRDAAPARPAEGGGGPAPRVVVRAPANLRAGPSGSAAVLRTASRGTALQLLDRAPGGWVQVAEPGAPDPLGWIHASLIEPEAR